jgi:hypothetical protein
VLVAARMTLDTYTHALPAIDRAAVDQLTTLLDKTAEQMRAAEA